MHKKMSIFACENNGNWKAIFNDPSEWLWYMDTVVKPMPVCFLDKNQILYQLAPTSLSHKEQLANTIFIPGRKPEQIITVVSFLQPDPRARGFNIWEVHMLLQCGSLFHFISPELTYCLMFLLKTPLNGYQDTSAEAQTGPYKSQLS